jgi:SH3-like domain-containing protein
MLRFLLPLAILAGVLMLPTTASAQVVEGEEHCVVNIKTSDVLNVRSKPSVSGKLLGSLDYSECGVVVVDACVGNWCPVETDFVSGWVNRKYISMVSPALYCVTGVSAGDKLNLRAYPSPTSKVIAKLSRHQCDIAFLPYAVGSWQKIRVEGDLEGWVNRKYVSGE